MLNGLMLLVHEVPIIQTLIFFLNSSSAKTEYPFPSLGADCSQNNWVKIVHYLVGGIFSTGQRPNIYMTMECG